MTTPKSTSSTSESSCESGASDYLTGLALESRLRCPSCGHRWTEIMPENACIQWSDCPSCKTRLKPKKGDCCVYCSHGEMPCPPIQKAGKSCCAGD
jgi:hypothetical protein